MRTIHRSSSPVGEDDTCSTAGWVVALQVAYATIIDQAYTLFLDSKD